MSLEHFRPLLAATIENDEQIKGLHFPLVASPKIDGIRAIIHPLHGPVTRSLKPIGNLHVRLSLSLLAGTGYDGEITVGPNHGPDVFANTTGAVRRATGQPDFTYWVFDSITQHSETYWDRFVPLASPWPFVRFLEFRVVNNPEAVAAYEADCLARGYEGIMLRKATRPYKFGRATVADETLMKLKRFQDAEAVITGYVPLMHNTNPLETNALGLSERSSAKAGKVPMDTLGKIIAHSETFGEIKIGSGFTEEQRREIWHNQRKYLGKAVTYKYQGIGTDEKPRFPIFMRFRPEE